jgi:hypothetical protein
MAGAKQLNGCDDQARERVRSLLAKAPPFFKLGHFQHSTRTVKDFARSAMSTNFSSLVRG